MENATSSTTASSSDFSVKSFLGVVSDITNSFTDYVLPVFILITLINNVIIVILMSADAKIRGSLAYSVRNYYLAISISDIIYSFYIFEGIEELITCFYLFY